ncbi:V-type proton ATPase subunit C 2 isoform X5 [Marmota marmota marmota]|uniref:V-type proton ATPase subunit C 2 isoform X5 n=1 Tax=Marmota marmota marmota TaxID=9994 RepID=UPI0020939F0C|nr:V-type proton ATPase subunit C 2 isoform X5 [Marmota marmota marmota]
MSEFWLISAPGDKENLQALERMNTVTSKSNLSYNTKFAIPDFKVGTLDSLVGLSDELGKLDTFAESLIKRMAQSVVEVMEDSKGKVQENLLANGVDLTSFVTHFEWDMAKYPAKQPLVNVVDTLAKQLAQIESDLKSRTAAYSALKTTLENLEKRSTGNLFTRTLSDIVSKEDFVLDSEYLVTLLVIVPKPSYAQWRKTYESLSDMVVPRSTKLIAEDNEGGLFTVTLFRKVIDDFKIKAKENKFTVREFFYDEKEIKREREEMTRLLSDKKQQYQTSCVALKKGSSTFRDHKVKVTPLGNPDRPAAGQTDRERESEGEGEVSSPRESWGSLRASPCQLRCLLRNRVLAFLLSHPACEFLNSFEEPGITPSSDLQAPLELPLPAGNGACGPACLCPGQGPLLRWLKVNFSEAFVAWIHIKALRVFVESVLRYGLPVNFQAVLLQPHKKSATKRLREVLNSVFRHLDEVAAASILDASVEIPGLQLSNQDYFPYVYFHIDLGLLD